MYRIKVELYIWGTTVNAGWNEISSKNGCLPKRTCFFIWLLLCQVSFIIRRDCIKNECSLGKMCFFSFPLPIMRKNYKASGMCLLFWRILAISFSWKLKLRQHFLSVLPQSQFSDFEYRVLRWKHIYFIFGHSNRTRTINILLEAHSLNTKIQLIIPSTKRIHRIEWLTRNWM